ncbi:MAG: FAD-dependent oxidoreductase [Paraperlucidibaca sp.]
MTINSTQHLVLIGGGHGHLAVLEAMRQHPLPAQVTLVTPDPMLTYSGLLPAYLAGHVSLSQCQIAVADYARAAGVTVIIDRLVALDAEQQQCQLASGNTLRYDWLSLDTGSVTANLPGATEVAVLPVRPLDGLLTSRTAKRVIVVGGGAGGVELAFAYAHSGATVSLISGAELMPGHHRRVAKTTAYWLKQRGIRAYSARAQLSTRGVTLHLTADLQTGMPNGPRTELEADLVIVATGASAPEWIKHSDLRRSPQGFVAVNDTLQSQSHPTVFAIGDVSAAPHPAITRAGVHAVMAGPVLAKNLRQALTRRATTRWQLMPYRPKRVSLFLLATGPEHAILSWGPIVLNGRWLWWLKRFIDTRFVERYRLSAL